MTRRGFLSTLAAAIAGATLDIERLLWVPGRKRIFIPPARTASLNRLILPADFSKLLFEQIREQMVFARLVNRQYDQSFRVDLRFTIGEEFPVRHQARIAS